MVVSAELADSASNASRVRKFIGCAIVPTGEGFITPASGSEPPVPNAFLWEGRRLAVKAVLRAWRSTKTDRGDNYLKRHWFELETNEGERLEVYFDREARRNDAKWWLYTVQI